MSTKESLYLLHTLEVTRRDAEEVERRVRERAEQRLLRSESPTVRLRATTVPPPDSPTRYSIIRGRTDDEP